MKAKKKKTSARADRRYQTVQDLELLDLYLEASDEGLLSLSQEAEILAELERRGVYRETEWEKDCYACRMIALEGARYKLTLH